MDCGLAQLRQKIVLKPASQATLEVDGRTTLTLLVQHSSKEHRDMHLTYGMEGGMQEAMDHLERVAVSLR